MNYNNAAWQQLIPPTTTTVIPATSTSSAAVTISSRVIDTQGFSYLEVCANIGAAGTFIAATTTGQSPICLWESDVASSATLLSSALQVPGAAFGISMAPSVPTSLYPEQEIYATSTPPSSSISNSLFLINVDLKGRKRYLQLVGSLGSTASFGVQFDAVARLSRQDTPPHLPAQMQLVSTSTGSVYSGTQLGGALQVPPYGPLVGTATTFNGASTLAGGTATGL